MKKYALKSLIFICLIFSFCANSFAQSPADPGSDPMDTSKAANNILSIVIKSSETNSNQKVFTFKNASSIGFLTLSNPKFYSANLYETKNKRLTKTTTSYFDLLYYTSMKT